MTQYTYEDKEAAFNALAAVRDKGFDLVVDAEPTDAHPAGLRLIDLRVEDGNKGERCLDRETYARAHAFVHVIWDLLTPKESKT